MPSVDGVKPPLKPGPPKPPSSDVGPPKPPPSLDVDDPPLGPPVIETDEAPPMGDLGTLLPGKVPPTYVAADGTYNIVLSDGTVINVISLPSQKK